MREHIIINELKNSSDYLSLEYFSQKLGVSTRTIRNDIKNIQHIMNINGFKIYHKSKLGYILKIEDNAKFENYIENSFSYLGEVPQQRLISIMVELGLSEDYKTIDYLSKKFLVSSSQIKNDLKKIDNDLKDIDLKIERKAHYGIKIIGPVKSIQKILSEAYFKNNLNITEYINKFIDKKKLDTIEREIKKLLKKHSLEINLIQLKEILAQIVILYTKASIREQEKIEKSKFDIKDVLIKDILENIFKSKKGYFKYEEYNYLKTLIKLKTKNKNIDMIDIEKSDLNDIICRFFNDIDEKYNVDFLEDIEFFNLFYFHIASLIERAKIEQSTKNYFSEKISQQYPTAFNLSIQFSKILEDKYKIKISKDEIGFIATYIAVLFEKREKTNFNKKYKIAIICSSGGGSSYIIKLRLKEIFVNSEIKNFSLLDEEKVINFDPDLIFSITDLSYKTNALVIRINEILDELDYINIKKSIQFTDSLISVSNPNQYIMSLFNKNHFRCINEKISYRQILYNMAKDIVDEGACAKTYPEDVWERESYLTTIYTNGVAIPHPIEMTGNKNIISVGLIQSDIRYELKKVKIIFMISLTKDSLELHKQISKYLTNIMMDRDAVDMLNKSLSYEEFMYKLKLFISGGFK